MTVRAENFFSDRPLPHQELAGVVAAFQELAAEIAGATLRSAAYEGRRDDRLRERRHLFASTFQGVFNRVDALVDLIRKAVDDIAELEVFFRIESSSAVVRWANEHPKIEGQFVMRGRGIGADNPPRGPISPPNCFSAPSLEGLEKFIKAVNAIELYAPLKEHG
jgi:hypothetical protein